MLTGGVKVALDVGLADRSRWGEQWYSGSRSGKWAATRCYCKENRQRTKDESIGKFELLKIAGVSSTEIPVLPSQSLNTILSIVNTNVNSAIFPFRWMTMSLPLNLGFLMRAQILNWTIQNISTLVEMVSFVLHSLTRSTESGYGSIKCVKSSNSLVTAVNFKLFYWFRNYQAWRWI